MHYSEVVFAAKRTKPATSCRVIAQPVDARCLAPRPGVPDRGAGDCRAACRCDLFREEDVGDTVPKESEHRPCAATFVAPTGYLNGPDRHGLVHDPERAPLVKRAFEMTAAGDRLGRMCSATFVVSG